MTLSALWVEDYERNSAVHEISGIMVRTSRPERTESELLRVDIKDSYPMGKLVLTPLRMFHKMGDGSVLSGLTFTNWRLWRCLCYWC